jgi:hypothetical protein
MEPTVSDFKRSGCDTEATGITRRDVLALTALGLIAGAPGSAVAAGPDGH